MGIDVLTPEDRRLFLMCVLSTVRAAGCVLFIPTWCGCSLAALPRDGCYHRCSGVCVFNGGTV